MTSATLPGSTRTGTTAPGANVPTSRRETTDGASPGSVYSYALASVDHDQGVARYTLHDSWQH
jgi:hypothetical protein